MAATIRDVVVRVAIEQQEAKLKAPDTSEVRAKIEELRQLYEQAFSAAPQFDFTFQPLEELRPQVEDLLDEFMRLGDGVKLVDTSSQSAARSMVDGFTGVGESLKQTGEGVFTLARGIAFLTTSSDTDFRKQLETIAKFQGAFDVFKGGVETVSGLSKAYTALTAATTVQTAANTGLAASNTAVAVTGSAAAAAMGSLLVTLGPAALLIGGAALILSQLELPDEEVNRTTDALAKFNIEQGRTNRAFEGQQAALKPLNEQLEFYRRRASELGSFRKNVEDFRILETDSSGLLTETGLFGPDITTFRGDEKGLEAARQRLDLNRSRLAVIGEEREAQEEVLRLLEAQYDARARELSVAKEQTQLAKETAEREANRLQSFEERLGRLSKSEFNQLTRLRDRALAGETLNNAQLERIEALGGGAVSGFVGGQFAARGRERGGAEFFRGIDDGEVTATQARRQEAIDRLADLDAEFGDSGSVGQGLIDLAEERQKAVDAQKRNVDKLIEIERQNTIIINEQAQRIAELEASIARGRST